MPFTSTSTTCESTNLNDGLELLGDGLTHLRQGQHRVHGHSLQRSDVVWKLSLYQTSAPVRWRVHHYQLRNYLWLKKNSVYMRGRICLEQILDMRSELPWTDVGQKWNIFSLCCQLRIQGGGRTKEAMPPPPVPVKTSHKKDGRHRRPLIFHVSCPPPSDHAGSDAGCGFDHRTHLYWQGYVRSLGWRSKD